MCTSRRVFCFCAYFPLLVLKCDRMAKNAKSPRGCTLKRRFLFISLPKSWSPALSDKNVSLTKRLVNYGSPLGPHLAPRLFLSIKKHSHTYLFMHCLWLLSSYGQVEYLPTESGRLIRLEIFTLWPLEEQFCQPLARCIRQERTVSLATQGWKGRSTGWAECWSWTAA